MLKQLDRLTFTVSRELEYFSEKELTVQTGYGWQHWWPGVVVKELVDNGLDACERAGTAPHIRVEIDGDSISVADNGPGLPEQVLEKTLDFATRTSDKAAYVSPTRGMQGNALKTILAIPYVLSGGSASHIEVAVNGVRHVVSVSTDQILQKPRIEHRTEEIAEKPGTVVRVARDSACSKETERKAEFLQELLLDYALFNPHASFELVSPGQRMQLPATRRDWRKWLPSDPTSPHWYDAERLESLIGCYLASEHHGERCRTVRDFVSEFRGLSSTAKQKLVTGQAGLERAYLRDLAQDGRFDRAIVTRLLAAMQRLSAPVKPEGLGVLGQEHFERHLKPLGASFRYACQRGVDSRGLPYVIECAFAMTDSGLFRGQHIGMNWSVPLTNPLQENVFQLGEDHSVWGLAALLAQYRIEMEQDPVCLVLHVICPRFDFLNRGKGNVNLPKSVAAAVASAVRSVTKEWAAVKNKQEREARQAERRLERYTQGRSQRITTKEAAQAVMAEAYLQASGGSRYQANARQIMYAARPAIQERTGQPLDDTYFTQVLLPDYVRQNPVETADWDVVYDARGHLWEPHTAVEIGLGTLGVRQYLSEMDAPCNLNYARSEGARRD